MVVRETLEILFKAKNEATSEIGKVSGELGKLSSLGKVAGGLALAGVAAGAAAAGTGILALGKGLDYAVQEAMAAQEIDAQLNAVLQSTGGAAGLTADQINAMALNLSQLTRFEDDAIVEGQTVLLQFTKIGEETFPQASEAMLDLSARMGVDLPTAAKLIGRTLEGEMGSLGRYGIVFDEATEKAIKGMFETGQEAEAQQIILGELGKKFGGAAKAAGETFAGQLDRVKNTLGNVAERIGFAVLPSIQKLADKVLAFVNSDKFQAWIEKVARWMENELPKAIEQATTFFQEKIIPAVNEFWPILRDYVIPALVGVAEILGKVLPPIVDAFVKGWQFAIDAVKFILYPITQAIESFGKIRDLLSDVKGWIDKVAQGFSNLSLPDWLTPGSPTPFEMGLRGISSAMKDLNNQGMSFSAAGGSAGMGGGGNNVIVNINSPVLGFSDRYELGRELGPIIKEYLNGRR